MIKKQLYRDTQNGKLGGVCAGLATAFGAEVWLVRLLFVSLFLFTGFFLAILIYIIACLLLEKMPIQKQQQNSVYANHSMKTKPWQQGHSAEKILENITTELDEIDQDLQKIENYVISFSFKMDREFNKH
ncbi:envelope stress response membrane protein PspC [Moritella marina ATCC 15381]|uniref:Envelope stress response membrane protein PspC n=1 Tax=Moritella marina ATCC 15381 TaxID=1202962 RepID=A0A5J6WGE1_MORMI|nr:envelope stress response membrane protein PspC [Moritella marina]QFI37079.1 envelope stress response membrane protein PspC [Moritella marina ATCC 15381]